MRELTEKEMNLVAGGISLHHEDSNALTPPTIPGSGSGALPSMGMNSGSGGNGGSGNGGSGNGGSGNGNGGSNNNSLQQQLQQASQQAEETCGKDNVKEVEVTQTSPSLNVGPGLSGGYSGGGGSMGFTCR